MASWCTLPFLCLVSAICLCDSVKRSPNTLGQENTKLGIRKISVTCFFPGKLKHFEASCSKVQSKFQPNKPVQRHENRVNDLDAEVNFSDLKGDDDIILSHSLFTQSNLQTRVQQPAATHFPTATIKCGSSACHSIHCTDSLQWANLFPIPVDISASCQAIYPSSRRYPTITLNFLPEPTFAPAFQDLVNSRRVVVSTPKEFTHQ